MSFSSADLPGTIGLGDELVVATGGRKPLQAVGGDGEERQGEQGERGKQRDARGGGSCEHA